MILLLSFVPSTYVRRVHPSPCCIIIIFATKKTFSNSIHTLFILATKKTFSTSIHSIWFTQKNTVALHNGTSYWEGGNRAAGFTRHLSYSKKLNRRRPRLWRCASYGKNLDYCWQTRLVSGKCDNAGHTCPSLIGYCLNNPSSGSSPAHGKNQPKSRERYTHSLTGSEILILSSLSASVSGFDGLREADCNQREPPTTHPRPKKSSLASPLNLFFTIVYLWRIGKYAFN